MSAAPQAAGALVTVDVRRVRPRDVPRLLVAGAAAVRRARRDPDVLLAKLLATTGEQFRPADLRPARWALLTVRADGAPARGWADVDPLESALLHLRPLSSRGSWDGRPLPAAARAWTGPVVMLTRATLRARRVRDFYAAVPAVAAEIAAAGVRAAFGFGESPALRQGTLSVWRTPADLAAFGRGAPAHRSAVRRTPEVGWYAEELFARLAVVAAVGSIDGVSMAAG